MHIQSGCVHGAASVHTEWVCSWSCKCAYRVGVFMELQVCIYRVGVFMELQVCIYRVGVFMELQVCIVCIQIVMMCIFVLQD